MRGISPCASLPGIDLLGVPSSVWARAHNGCKSLWRDNAISETEEWANRLAEARVKQKSFVAINLLNGLEHVVAT
jgi:hypothetical protein